MRFRTGGFLVVLALCGAGRQAAAQSAPEAGAAEPVPNTDVGVSGGSLSDKLNATNGVIHPEGTVDPGMQKPAPAVGSMPVIPPPGSPGGASGVQPK